MLFSCGLQFINTRTGTLSGYVPRCQPWVQSGFGIAHVPHRSTVVLGNGAEITALIALQELGLGLSWTLVSVTWVKLSSLHCQLMFSTDPLIQSMWLSFVPSSVFHWRRFITHCGVGFFCWLFTTTSASMSHHIKWFRQPSGQRFMVRSFPNQFRPFISEKTEHHKTQVEFHLSASCC